MGVAAESWQSTRSEERKEEIGNDCWLDWKVAEWYLSEMVAWRTAVSFESSFPDKTPSCNSSLQSSVPVSVTITTKCAYR
jgi:hypothetical protein